MLNALSPIDFTLLGIVTDARLSQPLNADDPISVTPFSIITSFILSGITVPSSCHDVVPVFEVTVRVPVESSNSQPSPDVLADCTFIKLIFSSSSE